MFLEIIQGNRSLSYQTIFTRTFQPSSPLPTKKLQQVWQKKAKITPPHDVTSLWMLCTAHFMCEQRLETSMFIPDSTLLTQGEIWDRHGNFQPLHCCYHACQKHGHIVQAQKSAAFNYLQYNSSSLDLRNIDLTWPDPNDYCRELSSAQQWFAANNFAVCIQEKSW